MHQEHLNLVPTNAVLDGHLHPTQFLMFSPLGLGVPKCLELDLRYGEKMHSQVSSETK